LRNKEGKKGSEVEELQMDIGEEKEDGESCSAGSKVKGGRGG